MKKALLLCVFLIVAHLGLNAQWTYDASHSSVNFAVDHMVVSETVGKFKTAKVNVTTTKADFSDMKIDATIDIKSISTDDAKRDEHLAGADFFDAAKYPTMTFVSKSVEKKDDKNYVIKGDLTMKGVTKSVALQTKFKGTSKDPWGSTRAGFKAETTINRQDFGLTWNKTLDTGGLAVGDEIRITINVELMKK